MQKNNARYWRSVFRRTLARYDETKSVHGTNSCAAFYNGLQQEGGRGGFNVKVIRVLPSDFIADVELAARRALNDNEQFLFKKLYLDKDREFEQEASKTLGDERLRVLKHTVQEKVGKMLLARRIYPIENYMKAVDLR